MSTSDPYFQFPLCLLAYGDTISERLDGILQYSLLTKGRILWESLQKQERARQLAEWERMSSPKGFRKDYFEHCAARYGADCLGVSLPRVRRVLDTSQLVQEFYQSFVCRHGADVQTRLRCGFLFETRDGNGMSYDEFAVLAAIYSVIGNKQRPVRITRAAIRRRALGYRTAKIMELEMSRRADGASPLSDWRLRRLIEDLQERKFFVRCLYGRRLAYYSHRMNRKDMDAWILRHHTYRASFQAIRRTEDEGLTNAIRVQRAVLAGHRPPPSNPDRPLPPPEEPWEVEERMAEDQTAG